MTDETTERAQAPFVPASFPSGERWYVVNTYHRREERAQEEIKELGFEAYLPKEKYRTVKSNRKIEAVRVLLPQYLFVRFDINHDAWGLIRDCNAVREILGLDGIPRAVPEKIMEHLRLAEDIGMFDRTIEHLNMAQGTPLEIQEGPFAYYIAEFVSAPSKRRIEVLLTLFNGKTRIELPIENVRKV